MKSITGITGIKSIKGFIVMACDTSGTFVTCGTF